MERDEVVDYWFGLADYDLKTAKVCFEGKRYLYVGFMCHQVMEKALKAIYVKERNELPPHSHNLLNLIEHLSLQIPEDMKTFFEWVNPLNIEARYPDMKQKLTRILTRSKAEELLKKTQEVYKWLQSQKM